MTQKVTLTRILWVKLPKVYELVTKSVRNDGNRLKTAQKVRNEQAKDLHGHQASSTVRFKGLT